jgi:hypothetical protein
MQRNFFTGRFVILDGEVKWITTSRTVHQYEHINESAEKSGRYGDRAEEVAARTVMKQHKEKNHKKGQ